MSAAQVPADPTIALELEVDFHRRREMAAANEFAEDVKSEWRRLRVELTGRLLRSLHRLDAMRERRKTAERALARWRHRDRSG